MAEYDNTKLWWLMLMENFFDDETIKWLEEQKNGKEYVLFYLKLCLKSLKTNGVLIRKIGEMYIPYTLEKIAEITNTNVDTATVALVALEKVGLIKRFDAGEILMNNISNMIGKQSRGAFKKQQYRSLQKAIENGGVDNCPPFCPPEYRTISKNLELDVCVDARTHTHAREESEKITCQRKKTFKDNTCKDCWHYSECDKKMANQPDWIAKHLEETKEKINKQNAKKESLEELEKFFNELN